jgi:F-type H+-transporting ATPase subunit delta
MPSAVAFRYARALVDVVTAPGAVAAPRDPRAVGIQLAEFEQLLQQNAELRILFATPAIPAAKKNAVLGGIVPILELQPFTHRFLSVVLQHDRISLLGEITEAYEFLLNERLGVVVAQVTSARALGETEKQELAGALRARTGKQVQMTFALDPGLIGGAVAQVGSTIYDGSVRGQLDRLRAELAGQAATSPS